MGFLGSGRKKEWGAGASGPCRGLGQRPKNLCRSKSRERCERPKARREACALWALATGGGKATRSAPEGSVSPVGCCAQRKATRRCEQIQGLRAASAQNADICEGSETMSATVREARMIEQPGRKKHGSFQNQGFFNSLSPPQADSDCWQTFFPGGLEGRRSPNEIRRASAFRFP